MNINIHEMNIDMQGIDRVELCNWLTKVCDCEIKVSIFHHIDDHADEIETRLAFYAIKNDKFIDSFYCLFTKKLGVK